MAIILVLGSLFSHRSYQSSRQVPRSSKLIADNWENYFNYRYGYRIKYPQNWNVSIVINNVNTETVKPIYVVQQRVEIINKVPSRGVIYIDTLLNPSRLSLLDWVSFAQFEFDKVSLVKRSTVFGTDLPLPDRTNYSVGGSPSILINKKLSNQTPGITTVVTSNNRYIYEISLIDTDNPDIKQMYSSMLQSFSFIGN